MTGDGESENGDGRPHNRGERSIDIHGHVYRLTAQRPETGSGWIARILNYSMRSESAQFRHPILDDRSALHDKAAIVREFRGVGANERDALDDLETKLRVAVSEAVRSTDMVIRT